MAVRATMSNLISRVRLLVNDPSGASQIFSDQTYQDVLDASRINYRYLTLSPSPTYSGSTISYLDYYSDLGDWEDDITLWQYRITQVTPATSENIVGHWTFAATTLPPVFAIGKSYDIYRAAADLLERQAAMWTLSYSINVDGQTLNRNQAQQALRDLAKQYRMKQRAHSISAIRLDINGKGTVLNAGLGPLEIDRMARG